MKIKVVTAGILSVFLFASWQNAPAFARDANDYKIYVALGFHVNLIHSFRGDTPDEAGFGQDIRIIRKTIDTLNMYNKRGVDVKAVWDFDNLFSLQDILPKYAPDIIDNIKTRVKAERDEVILMSYNNAVSSALTEGEFRLSVRRAITNKAQSGVKDIFGEFSPIVRPQEMMTTPGNFNLYKKLGIKAVVLYYSAIPFDAIRSFIRPLRRYEAHNPLNYVNRETGEKMVVIPAYNTGDLVENGSLRSWARTLHKKQISGEIKGDLLIFINSDADDPYWYGYGLPWYLNWLPNANGVEQLIEEISELEYVKFTTLADYLKGHPPVGEISFGQDTADGSFSGYNSWAEKPSSQAYWTHIVANRRAHRLIKKIFEAEALPVSSEISNLLKLSMGKRLELLSATNFGIAAPFLVRGRIKAADKIVREMKVYSGMALELALKVTDKKLNNAYGAILKPSNSTFLKSFMFFNSQKENLAKAGQFLTLEIAGAAFEKGATFNIISKNGTIIIPYVIDIFRDDNRQLNLLKLYVANSYRMVDGTYFLYSTKNQKNKKSGGPVFASKKVFKNQYIEVRLSDNGFISEVMYKGIRQLEAGSLMPGVNYKTESGLQKFSPENFNLVVGRDGSTGVASLRLLASFKIGEGDRLSLGYVNYKLTLISGVPYLFIEGNVSYPATMPDAFLPGSNPLLARMYDAKWAEVMPTELIFSHKAETRTPFKILKRNYLGKDSSYKLDYFKRSEKNLNLASVNNHITSEYVAVVAKEKGVAVAMDTTVLASFAFCPMKLDFDPEKSLFTIRLNPFGTYYGPQYYQPTWGQGIGRQGALIVGPQFNSSASAYNGSQQKFSLMVAFFDDKNIPSQVKKDLIGFADPPFVLTRKNKLKPVEKLQRNERPMPPKGFVAVPTTKGVRFQWEPGFKVASYRVRINDDKGKPKAEIINALEFKAGSAGLRVWPDLPFLLKLKIIFSGIAEKILFLPVFNLS